MCSRGHHYIFDDDIGAASGGKGIGRVAKVFAQIRQTSRRVINIQVDKEPMRGGLCTLIPDGNGGGIGVCVKGDAGHD